VHVTYKRGDIWLLTTERYDLADGLTIRLRERRGARGRPAAFSRAGDFLIERLESFPFDIAAGLAAAWLYDVLKQHRAMVRMDGKEVSADDKNKLKRFIREHILRSAPKGAAPGKKRRARPKRKRRES